MSFLLCYLLDVTGLVPVSHDHVQPWTSIQAPIVPLALHSFIVDIEDLPP